VFKMDQENIRVRMCVEVLICDIYIVRKWVCDFVGIYVCMGLLTYNI
jgi:hypothetical protein